MKQSSLARLLTFLSRLDRGDKSDRVLIKEFNREAEKAVQSVLH